MVQPVKRAQPLPEKQQGRRALQHRQGKAQHDAEMTAEQLAHELSGT